ncbi:MAG TPA: transposase [Fibrobacteraceae bacterium]|nr:transposase [Fibrobacteraceae bacterium]
MRFFVKIGPLHQINDKATSRTPRIQQTVFQFEEYEPISSHSRENRQWRKERGIILGAPPVCRPPLNRVERKNAAKKVRQNELDRIGVEGKFGVAKRRFRLDRLMTCLRKCSECAISLVFMVMNLKKFVRLLFVRSAFSIQNLTLGSTLRVSEDYSASKRWLTMA